MIELHRRLGVILDCTLSMQEKFLLLHLHRDADNSTCITHPGVRRLQNAMGCKREKIVAQLKAFEELQIISKVRNHRGSYRTEYYINYDKLYLMNRFVKEEGEEIKQEIVFDRPTEDQWIKMGLLKREELIRK